MVDTEGSLAFEVSKADPKKTRVVLDTISGDLEPGQVLLKVDRFALTANNITYAMVGEAIGYWKFFPAEDGWGRIPASAFADVVRSNHPDIPEGERVLTYSWVFLERSDDSLSADFDGRLTLTVSHGTSGAAAPRTRAVLVRR